MLLRYEGGEAEKAIKHFSVFRESYMLNWLRRELECDKGQSIMDKILTSDNLLILTIIPLVTLLLAISSCTDSGYKTKSGVHYYKLCVEHHSYIKVDRGIAPELDDTGKPIKCNK